MEKLQLTTAVVTTTTLSDYEIAGLFLGWRQKVILIHLVGTNGERKEERIEDTETNPEATNLMKALNTANLTIKSLHRRVMEYLINNRGYAATVTGTPE
jgi:hypothetical protein